MVITIKTWVWDLSVRFAHWLLAISFATAFATGESENWRLIHAYSGGAVLGIVCFRLIWGFVGTPLARFSTFVHHPRLALAYLSSVATGKPQHHTGHNPAGGWAVMGLLGLSSASAITGYLVYQGNAVPWLEKSHELLANLALTLVVIHVLAVLVSSKLHQDNLVKTMITGHKPYVSNETPHPAFTLKTQLLGLLLLFVCMLIGAWVATQ